MKTDADDPFSNHSDSFEQDATDPLGRRSAENLTAVHNTDPNIARQQVEISVNWEIVRRKAQKVTSTEFFQDLMKNIVARRRCRRSHSATGGGAPS